MDLSWKAFYSVDEFLADNWEAAHLKHDLIVGSGSRLTNEWDV